MPTKCTQGPSGYSTPVRYAEWWKAVDGNALLSARLSTGSPPIGAPQAMLGYWEGRLGRPVGVPIAESGGPNGEGVS